MLELITSAVQAILQVIVVVICGVILTKAGYFNSAQQKWLSNVNMVFFTPCLLFSNIASVISIDKLIAFWPIPVFFTVFSLMSWLVGQVMLRLFGVHGPYKRFVEACSLFCNSNSMPIAIISSLALSEAGPLLYWHANDTQQEVAARGVAYTLFYAMFCNIIRWSYGYHLLQRHSKDDTELGWDTESNSGMISSISNNKINGSHKDRHPSEIQYNNNPDDLSSSSSSSSRNDTKQDDIIQGNPFSPPSPTLLLSFPKLPNESSPLLAHSTATTAGPTSNDPWTTSIRQQLEKAAFEVHGYMSPPLYSALLALVVGLSPLQPLLFDPHAFLYPSVTKAIQSCGKAAVPLILVCLGSQLTLIAQQQPRPTEDYHRHHGALSLSRRAVIASLVTRIVTPVLVIGLVMVCLKDTLMVTVTIDLMQDPMFVVAIIILGCTPTAINLSQITQVNGIFEEEMMQVLFWSYGIVCIPVMTLVVFVALTLVDKSI